MTDNTKPGSQSDAKSDALPMVVAITGASGAIYGLRLLQYLMEIEQPVDLLLSRAAMRVMQEEHDLTFEGDVLSGLLSYLKLPDTVPVKLHSLGDYGASVASGSYRTMGMVVLPCSLGTLGALSAGLTENLIHRAGAVTLKEKRKLMIVVREMPFGHIQLKNMLALSEAGAIVSCASPGFYHRPATVGDQIDFVVGRVLDQFDFDNKLFKRWKEDSRPIVQPTKSKAK
ncbi:MAG: UbiX family flavin prenyltransferase [Candidatus Obscuribacter sp.]|nr:UbiX family flavin prenyltransferase [Candidatus Obscuribacter sp.]MBP6594259.1 UbiX family flavin prenyltransferase [Candidatus Obscuribacter sp.]MBP7578138.1 UbiX family flavin prenyltransferase [Candidatus Obscuribacter sp.]